MGFLSKLFGETDSIEKKLEEQYVSSLMKARGAPLIEAKEIVRGMIRKAKDDAIKEGTTNLPKNIGDLLLEKSKKDEKLRNSIAMKKGDGVREDDYRRWWNMHDLERRLLVIDDDISRGSAFIQRREQGDSPEKAALYVRKHYPIYGDPVDNEHASGEDRPIPYELKDRINIFFQKMKEQSPVNFQKEIDKSTSFNAYIRREIKAGKC